MKRKLVYLFLTLLMFNTLGVRLGKANPDYDMLIITPNLFIEEVEPLKDFKDHTSRPTVIATLDDIYNDYPGVDKAEQVKKCIADYEENHNIKYVLLMGDVDKVPIRYFLVETYNPSEQGEEIQWFAYYMTDQYYADLYASVGGFNDWNADGDDYYGETYRVAPSKDINNTDGVDFHWDVIVGRVPASTESQVTNYVDKVIDYELNTYTSDPWFRNELLVSGVGGSIYPEEIDYTTEFPPYDDLEVLDEIGTIMTGSGYTTTKIYHFGTTLVPDPAIINTELNKGAGFFTVYSHQDQYSFGDGVYNFPQNMTGLANDGKLPIVFSLGCSPGKTGPIAPNEDYLDTSAALQNYGITYPQPEAGWTAPEPPNVWQRTTDQDAVPDYLLVSYPDRGSIAFIGSMAEAIPSVCKPAAKTFHQSIAGGEMILGEAWKDVDEHMVVNFPLDSNWEYCRRWLFMNLFGDPSLRIGGLLDKTSPTTSIEVGEFNYVEGNITYVKTPVEFTVTSEDSDFERALYKMYPSTDPHNLWLEGTSFTLYADADVEYTVEVMGEDTSGNREYPHNIELVTVDNTPGTTTVSIGSPKVEQYGGVTVTSETLFTLTQTDSGSGPNIIYYSIWDVPPGDRDRDTAPIVPDQEYTTPFTISEPDKRYYLDYRSYDNVHNLENTTTVEILLDNSITYAELKNGDPNYLKGTEFWVTSETPFIVESFDLPAGVETIEYTLTKIGTSYNSVPVTYNGSFTLPKNNNDNEVHWLIEVEVIDKVGNTKTLSQLVWVEDRAPLSYLTYDAHYYEPGITDYVYVSSATNFGFEPTDTFGANTGVGVNYTDYSIDGGTLIRYTLGDTFSLSGPDGVHTIEGISVDLLGNIEEPLVREFFLDNTPPETTLGVNTSSGMVLEAEDNACGVASTLYQINGGGFTNYTGTFDLEGVDGLYSIEYYSIDNLGNEEPVKSVDLCNFNLTTGTHSLSLLGNCTISNLSSDENEIEFSVDGPSGETAYVYIMFPMINTTKLKIFVDGVELVPPPYPIITSNGTQYLIYFELTLSRHSIELEFGPEPPVGGEVIPKCIIFRKLLNIIIFTVITILSQLFVKNSGKLKLNIYNFSMQNSSHQ
ncbi:hypothetical protein GF319_10935 [Candidatus Bathyarchaeota archaeon]|nr:hypothetical protein [Candidatus Bathyarchaeota archaeon]